MRIETRNDDSFVGCPAKTALRMLAIDPDGEGMDVVAAHLFVCARCQKAFEDVLYPPEECSLSKEELRTIDELVRARCRSYDPFRKLRTWILMHPPVPRPVETKVDDESYFRKAAASDSRRPKTADSEMISLTYASFSGRASGNAWRAYLSFPSSPSDKTRMALAVMRPDGCPAEGVFVVAGVSVSLSGGCGEIAYPRFVAGLKDPEVKLEYPDGTSSTGTLVLF